MNVAVIGAGKMGAQIGCEYALGGHTVCLVAPNSAAALERVDAGFALLARFGLHTAERMASARNLISCITGLSRLPSCDLAVESVPEDFELKTRVLQTVAHASTSAVLATNTSSLSITRLGDAAGAPERTIGTHYWNPPLLMPLVEVIPGKVTSEAVTSQVAEILRELGKRPIQVERDVPGFVWNRLQSAVLREAAWIAENGSRPRVRWTKF